jgi:glutamyl-tRNA synthetase
MVRVRFAPSPTGYLHVGGLRTALYSELFARKNNGVLILRIEDTDQARTVEGGIENIIRTLAWAGIKVDEGPYLDKQGILRQHGDYGPYIQSERLAIYQKYVQQLLTAGKAYRCFCRAERLDAMRSEQQTLGGRTMYDRHCRDLSTEEEAAELGKETPFVVRLKVPLTGSSSWHDLIRGHIEVANDQIDDQILLKSDGFPTYHLANIVDDHLMGVTHVIRGEEWCPSTPKHILLYQAFGWVQPEFAHLPLLLNPDRSKLSKRQGDVAVEDYQAKGYLPEALVNFVSLLGWNPSGNREIYSKDDLIAEFDLTKINRGGAVFDLQKLNWMNGEYIKKLPSLELAARALSNFKSANLIRQNGYELLNNLTGEPITLEWLAKVVSIEQQRIKTLMELPEVTEFLFISKLDYDPALLPWKKSNSVEAKVRLEGLLDFFTTLTDKKFADKQIIEKEIIKFVVDQNWTNAESLWPLRVALTGRSASPGPFEVAWVLGKEATLSRIKEALSKL